MQHKHAISTMTDIMAKFTNYIGKHLPDDIMGKLRELRPAEVSPLASVVYDSMFENLAKADELDRPCCQDTGVIHYFLKAGADLPLLADVRVILEQAMRIALATLQPSYPAAPRIVRIKNTKELETIWVSESYKPYLKTCPNLEVIGTPHTFGFSQNGSLLFEEKS